MLPNTYCINNRKKIQYKIVQKKKLTKKQVRMTGLRSTALLMVTPATKKGKERHYYLKGEADKNRGNYQVCGFEFE